MGQNSTSSHSGALERMGLREAPPDAAWGRIPSDVAGATRESAADLREEWGLKPQEDASEEGKEEGQERQVPDEKPDAEVEEKEASEGEGEEDEEGEEVGEGEGEEGEEGEVKEPGAKPEPTKVRAPAKPSEIEQAWTDEIKTLRGERAELKTQLDRQGRILEQALARLGLGPEDAPQAAQVDPKVARLAAYARSLDGRTDVDDGFKAFIGEMVAGQIQVTQELARMRAEREQVAARHQNQETFAQIERYRKAYPYAPPNDVLWRFATERNADGTSKSLIQCTKEAHEDQLGRMRGPANGRKSPNAPAKSIERRPQPPGVDRVMAPHGATRTGSTAPPSGRLDFSKTSDPFELAEEIARKNPRLRGLFG